MESHKNVSRAAGTVGGMTLVSRLFGFLRDAVIAMMYGASSSADAFFVAFRIPNLQRRLLGEGAIGSAFIPVFSQYLGEKSEKEAWNLAASLFNILVLFLTATTALIYFFAPWVIAVFAPGFLDQPDKFDLAVQLTRWMSPFLICIGLAAFCMGVLNSFKVFALSAAAPTILNISMILAALFLTPYFDEPILALAVGVLIGGCIQFAVQFWAVLKKGFRFVSGFNWRNPGIVRIGKLILPAIFGLAVYEVNIMVDTLLASLLAEGSISYLYYANRLVQLPMGVFAVALSVAILPTLSDQAAKNNFSELIQTLNFGIRLILFITIPSMAGLVILRFPIVNALWERGEFDRATTDGTAFALLFYSLGLCAFAGIKVVVAAFYSLQDTKTPARIGIYAMLLNIVFCLLLMGPLAHGGLALATTLSSLFNVGALVFILKKRFGLIGGKKIVASIGKTSLSTLLMGAAVYFFNDAFYNPDAVLLVKLTVLAATIFLGVGLFLAISSLLKNEELTFLKKMFRERKSADPALQNDYND